MFDELTQIIDEHLATQPNICVAISGFGGAGKTTLTNQLRDHYDVKDSQVVRLDNFLINRGEGSGYLGGYDLARFENVLEAIQKGERLHYQVYDWAKDALTEWYIDEPLPRVVLVEGVRLLHPRYRKYFDVMVWIDCPIEVATQRGKQRDRDNNTDEQYDIKAHLKKWDTVWVPKDKQYYEEVKPNTFADLIYEGDS